MRLQGRRCLVVGAGPVGLRKAQGLLAAGAEVVLVDPQRPAKEVPGAAEFRQRPFREDDLDGAFLAFAAAGDSEVNRAVAAAARRRGVPVNSADDPGACDFFVPACFRSGDLTVAVATSGVSPALAAVLRDELEMILPGEWRLLLEIAGKLRSGRLTSSSGSAYNQQVLRNLVDGGILPLLARGDRPGVDRLLEAEVGRGCSLAELGISLPKGSS